MWSNGNPYVGNMVALAVLTKPGVHVGPGNVFLHSKVSLSSCHGVLLHNWSARWKWGTQPSLGHIQLWAWTWLLSSMRNFILTSVAMDPAANKERVWFLINVWIALIVPQSCQGFPVVIFDYILEGILVPQVFFLKLKGLDRALFLQCCPSLIMIPPVSGFSSTAGSWPGFVAEKGKGIHGHIGLTKPTHVVHHDSSHNWFPQHCSPNWISQCQDLHFVSEEWWDADATKNPIYPWACCRNVPGKAI